MLRWLLTLALPIALLTGAAAAGTPSIGGAFNHTWSHAESANCGQPIRFPTWTSAHRGHQKFQHCVLEVKVWRKVTATSTPVATSTAIPASPVPTAVATPTAPVPSDPASYLLSLINGARTQAGLPAYQYDPNESPCSLAHSQHMSAEGYISHDQFPADICVPYTRGAGENVAMGSGDALSVVQLTFNEMMAEGPAGGHYQNIMSSTYTRVGIGIYVASNGVWITEDLTG